MATQKSSRGGLTKIICRESKSNSTCHLPDQTLLKTHMMYHRTTYAPIVSTYIVVAYPGAPCGE